MGKSTLNIKEEQLNQTPIVPRLTKVRICRMNHMCIKKYEAVVDIPYNIELFKLRRVKESPLEYCVMC